MEHVLEHIAGWPSNNNGIEIQNNVAGSSAEGNQHVELDTYTPVEHVSGHRDGSWTVLHVPLRLIPRPGVGDNSITASWDGSAVSTLNDFGGYYSDTVWNYYEYTVVATSTTTRIEFADTSWADSLGGYVDDVSVVANPYQVKALFSETKAHKSGSTIPVKLQICDNDVNVPRLI